MNTWLTVGEGLVAASISVVGLVFTASANRRSQYDRVLTLVAESGSQPLADDRHVIGLLFHSEPKPTVGDELVLSGDEIAAFFRMLWYFERANALFESLRPPRSRGRVTRAQALLLRSLGPTVRIWRGYIEYCMKNTADGEVDTSGNDEGLRVLSCQYNHFHPAESEQHLGPQSPLSHESRSPSSPGHPN